MLLSLKGIVFRTTKYKESSVISQIYSDKLGLSSHLMNGVRNFKSKTSPALFQPGRIIDFEIYYKEGSSIHRIKEIKNGLTYGLHPDEIQRGALKLFMAEVSYRTIIESEKNERLFSFLLKFFSNLESPNLGLGLYPLLFLAQLTKFLGIHPDFSQGANGGYLDLQEGLILNSIPRHNKFASRDLTEFWKICASANPLEKGKLSLKKEDKEILLERMLEYYEMHIPGMKPIRSHLIFRKIFNP